jgi:hypothetical protein
MVDRKAKEGIMLVKAAPGSRCPKEGKPREFITDGNAVEVADSAFYRRLIADGSLVEEKVPGTRKKEQGKKEILEP